MKNKLLFQCMLEPAHKNLLPPQKPEADRSILMSNAPLRLCTHPFMQTDHILSKSHRVCFLSITLYQNFPQRIRLRPVEETHLVSIPDDFLICVIQCSDYGGWYIALRKPRQNFFCLSRRNGRKKTSG